MEFEFDKEWFSNRLAQLRTQKNVSARDMSLTLGQGAGYINNIENGINYPSMTIFFYICEFLEVTPDVFFNPEMKRPYKTDRLTKLAESLSDEQLELLIAVAQEMLK